MPGKKKKYNARFPPVSKTSKQFMNEEFVSRTLYGSAFITTIDLRTSVKFGQTAKKVSSFVSTCRLG